MRAKVLLLSLLAAMAWAVASVGPAWAHEGEEAVPAIDSFTTAMALLQVQPDMTEMIEDQIADGLESDDVEGVDLDAARLAQEAFEAGNEAQALDLLAQATGMTPAEALAAQVGDVTRLREVTLADQLGSPGSVGRPSSAATAALAIGAILAIALGTLLTRRTR